MSEKTSDALRATLDATQKLYARKGASVAELEQVTTSLPDAIAGAESHRDALTGRRREILLAGSDADLVKLDGEIGAAHRLLDRLRAIAEELDARLAQAKEEASDAARSRRRAELIGERDSMADRYRKEYPNLAGRIVALMADAWRSEIAIDEFNRSAPAAEKIQSAEHIVRQCIAAPRQEIKRSIVYLWCREDENRPLPEEHQARVRDTGDGRGAILPSPGVIGSAQLFVRRKFERIEFRAAERPIYAPPLAKAVVLPGLVAGDPPIWQPAQDGTTAIHWLKTAEGSRAAAPAPFVSRPIEVELRLIDDGAVNDGGAPAKEPEPVEMDIARRAGK